MNFGELAEQFLNRANMALSNIPEGNDAERAVVLSNLASSAAALQLEETTRRNNILLQEVADSNHRLLAQMRQN